MLNGSIMYNLFNLCIGYKGVFGDRFHPKSQKSYKMMAMQVMK